MNSGYLILMALCGGVCVAAAVAHFTSVVILQFFIDHRRVQEETGEPGWKIFGSIMAPEEFYKPKARAIWRIRRISWKLLWIGFGLTVAVALAEGLVSSYRSI